MIRTIDLIQRQELVTAHCAGGEEHRYMVRDIRTVYHIFKSHVQV